MSHATSPPSIRIYDSGPSLHSRYALPRRSPPSYGTPSAIPMAIPNARESPPPPLPPPRYINELNDGQDAGWQWANSIHTGSYSRQTYPHIKEGSSLLGFSIGKSQPVRSDSDSSEDRSDHAPSGRDNSHSPPKRIQDDLASEQSDKEHGPVRPTLPDHRSVVILSLQSSMFLVSHRNCAPSPQDHLRVGTMIRSHRSKNRKLTPGQAPE
jgi:hypothetical protein